MHFGKRAEKPRRSIVSAVLFFTALSTSTYAAPTLVNDECSPEKIDAFRAAAQTQSDKTEALFRDLKDCSLARSELLLWMGYYYRSRGDYQNTLMEYDTEISSENSERDRLIAKANRGQTKELLKAVEADNSAYQSDAEAILVLARSLTRDSDFKKARDYYQRYFKLKPDDPEIEIEYAYSFLWSGDTKQAEAALEKMRKEAKTAEQARSAREGLKRLKLMGPHSFAEVIDRSDHLSLGFEHANNNFFNFSRNTTFFQYFVDRWNLDLRSHLITSSSYPNVFGMEGSAARSFSLSQTISAYGKLGYFATGHAGVPVAHVFLQKQIKSITPGIGVYNEPLARDIPLPVNGLGWNRSAVYFKLLFKQLLDYRLEFRSITSNTTSTAHFVRVNIPFKKNDEGLIPFELYLLGEFESFEKGSQYVYSPQNDAALKIGAQYTDQVTDEMDLKLNVEYGPFYESSRNTSTLTYGSAATLLGLGGEFGFKLDSDFFANFKVRFDRTASDASGTTYSSTLFGINLVWLMGDSQ